MPCLSTTRLLSSPEKLMWKGREQVSKTWTVNLEGIGHLCLGAELLEMDQAFLHFCREDKSALGQVVQSGHKLVWTPYICCSQSLQGVKLHGEEIQGRVFGARRSGQQDNSIRRSSMAFVLVILNSFRCWWWESSSWLLKLIPAWICRKHGCQRGFMRLCPSAHFLQIESSRHALIRKDDDMSLALLCLQAIRILHDLVPINWAESKRRKLGAQCSSKAGKPV